MTMLLLGLRPSLDQNLHPLLKDSDAEFGTEACGPSAAVRPARHSIQYLVGMQPDNPPRRKEPQALQGAVD